MSQPSEHPSGRGYALILTGRCAQARHCVLWSGHEVWLTGAHFEMLCALVRQRQDGAGFLPLKRVLVHRLRLALADAGVPNAADLIANGPVKCYFLNVPAEQVARDETFEQLPPGLIDGHLQRVLVDALPVVSLP